MREADFHDLAEPTKPVNMTLTVRESRYFWCSVGCGLLTLISVLGVVIRCAGKDAGWW